MIVCVVLKNALN